MYDVQIYGPPNPALSVILKSPELETIVNNYGVKVASVYRQNLGGRSSNLVNTVRVHTNANDGYENDRWVGVVTVGNAQYPYGAADEFGRHNPSDKQRGSTYDGSHALQSALYSVLPYPA